MERASVIYGYARVSTVGQAREGNSLEDQERKLRDAGCAEIFHDSCTGTKMERPEFTKLIARLRSGDRLVVTKLDRFARTTAEGVSAIRVLLDRGISVHVLNMGLIDNTPTGRLIVTILLAFAEFEREQILERTAAGKAIARSRPGFREGRKEKEVNADRLAEMAARQRAGEISVGECCAELGISRGTWYNRTRAIIGA